MCIFDPAGFNFEGEIFDTSLVINLGAKRIYSMNMQVFPKLRDIS